MMETSPNDSDGFPTSFSNSDSNMMTIDEDGVQNQNEHSLPAPEEVATPRRSKDTHPLLILAIAVLLLIMIIGLSVGLTADNRKDNGDSSTALPTDEMNAQKQKDRSNNLKLWLVDNEISEAATFNDDASPQAKALTFMSETDKMRFDIPDGDSSTEDGYTFLTRYVMTVFYYATDGPQWNYNLLFLSDNPVCDWFFVFTPPVGQIGVLCNQVTQTIVGFSFIDNNLGGTLPSELGHLTTLTYMETVQNNIAGTIPDSLQSLTKIRTCVFAHEKLTGQLPSWLGEWIDMTFFYVSNNQLTGQLPQNFDQLSKLEVLGLDDNLFDGSINKIWSLSNLENVYLDQNDFTGSLPFLITTMTPHLINLDLSGNSIDGPLPADIFALRQLEILDLHDNSFDGPLPSEEVLGSKMRFLTLHDNRLTQSIPTEFGLFKSLTHLDLSSNTLTGIIPTQLDQLVNMTYFFLAVNPLTPAPIPTFIYAYEKLRELNLKNTRRTGKIEEQINLLQNLVLLDLDDNVLTGNIPSTIGALNNLQFLLLNRNELDGTVPIELGDPPRLQFILLDRNDLTGNLDSVCNGNARLVGADCLELDCDCCDPCCTDGEECHDLAIVSSVEGLWESGYDRQFFQFSNSSEQYQIIDDLGV